MRYVDFEVEGNYESDNGIITVCGGKLVVGVRRIDPLDSKWVDPKNSGTKSKWAYPYSYSEFFIHGSHRAAQGCEAAYSDRIEEWNREAWEHAYQTVWGKIQNRYEFWTMEQFSEMLSLYWGYPVQCKAVAEGCHPVSQYPYYIFWWKKVENENVG